MAIAIDDFGERHPARSGLKHAADGDFNLLPDGAASAVYHDHRAIVEVRHSLLWLATLFDEANRELLAG